MNRLNPIYTEKTQCQDCFKCVRSCPVKAINVTGGSAQVIYDECILCGLCTGVCPVQAKKVRQDIGRARQLLKTKKKTIVSLAPSFAAQFEGLGTPGDIIALFKRLGFDGVSETALGAQEVTANLARIIKDTGGKIIISSACPVAVDLIAREYPEYIKYVSPLLSPMLAHGKLLKEKYGADTGVVFVGPCIAKKREADNHPELVDLALSFKEVENWIKTERLTDFKPEAQTDETFVPAPARDGRLYPIDGGMTESLIGHLGAEERAKTKTMFFSGISQIKKALTNIHLLEREDTVVFLELLACEGGCVNGPMAENPEATVLKRMAVMAKHDGTYDIRKDGICINADTQFKSREKEKLNIEPERIRQALNSVGKLTDADELNCGACGYDSCRDFARAMIANKAEKNMCVSYMRKLAQKKAMALMAAMPSGVVIVGKDMKVAECNMRFAQILGRDTQELYKELGTLENAFIDKVSPFGDIFEEIFERGTHLIERNIKTEDKVLKTTVFIIEKGTLAGGVIQDITAPAKYKQEIIRKSEQVIKNKIETVQKVAYLLGNNAAESEVLLSSVIDLFAAEGVGAEKED